MSKYKGMTNYGVLIQDIEDYAEEVGEDPIEVWKMCIDKMVENGAREYEGYSGTCSVDYGSQWHRWGYLFTSDEGNVYHYDEVDPGDSITTVKDLLGVDDIMIESQDSREEPPVVYKATSKEELEDELDKDAPILLPVQLKLYGGEDVLEFMKNNPNIILDPVNMGESNEASRRLLGIRGGIVVVEIVVVEV